MPMIDNAGARVEGSQDEVFVVLGRTFEQLLVETGMAERQAAELGYRYLARVHNRLAARQLIVRDLGDEP